MGDDLIQLGRELGGQSPCSQQLNIWLSLRIGLCGATIELSILIYTKVIGYSKNTLRQELLDYSRDKELLKFANI